MRSKVLPLCATLLFSALSACDGAPTDKDSADNTPTLHIGLLPDTQGHGDNVAIHPMVAVLDKERELGADIVIALGDLTNQGSGKEFLQWTSVARRYRDAGIEILPLMGNHESSHAYSVEWIETMKPYIPDDAQHMAGAQYLNYSVVRGNVLIILLKYYNLPLAFQWIKQVVNEHESEVDHILIASHDGLIGARYGETREMIVEGVPGDNLLMSQWDDIRAFFARHDIIWVQGHEHMYQRSLIRAPIHVDPVSWKKADGNYRLPQYTQIVAGNASYKGYDFRYGEREGVQRIVQQKMNTLKNGSSAYDVNASLLSYTGGRVDYQSWFASHTIDSNDEGEKELANPDWKLLDRFSRTKNRCERVVYPDSMPAGARPAMVLDSHYRGNQCPAPNGSAARLVAGNNNTFNRLDSSGRTMEIVPGFSRAADVPELMRLAYQYLFRYNQPWTPNLNAQRRVIPDPEDDRLLRIPATTIDLKEDVTLSWQERGGDTLSDILIVSGTQNQTGTYSSTWGAARDLEADPGLPGSQPDGSAKQPHLLPTGASKAWDLATALSDTYALTFDAPGNLAPESHILGTLDGNGDNGNWRPLASAACLVNAPFDESFLTVPPERPAGCRDQPLVGFDSAHGRRWWAVLRRDAELALIER